MICSFLWRRISRADLAGLRSILDELHLDWVVDHAGFHSAVEQEANGFSAAITVVQRPVVHVHPDESIGTFALQARAKRIA
jgi:hypothetical protein